MKRTRIALLAGVLAAMGPLPVPGTGSASAAQDPAVVGQWLAPFSEDGLFDERPPANREEAMLLPTAVSIAVSPDGTIVYWNGVEGYEDTELTLGIDPPEEKNRVRVLDIRGFLRGEDDKPKWTIPAQERGVGGDLFCSDLRNLADGRVLAVGGTEYRRTFPGEQPADLFLDAYGLDSSRIYDPETRLWTETGAMNHRRWYPSLISLPDGKMLVAGGVERVAWNDKAHYVNQTETFDPDTGQWTENGPGGSTALPYYARLHLLPSGKVLYDASGQMWGPLGPTADMAEWNKHKLYDPATGSWSEKGVAPFGGRSGAFSVMLPLEAPYTRAEVLIGGGTLGPAAPGSYVATPLTERLSADGDSIERRTAAPLNNPRWFSTGVVLPSGEVVAVSGGDRDDTVSPGTTGAVRQAELFDGERWSPLASAKRDRVYHSTGILLGDGSILVGGHAPVWFTPFALRHDESLGAVFSSNLRDPSFEIFRPPYLFRGERPRITEVQAGVEHGKAFTITTPDAGKVTSVVLSRLPSVTHLADVDQRTIELEFTRTKKGIKARVPANHSVALAGHYYLFLMADNGQGPTPSRAAIVDLGETDMTAAPLPYGS